MSRGNIRVKLVFSGDEKTLRSLYDSLHPDNVTAPDYMKIEEQIAGGKYVLVFSGDLRGRVIDSIRQSVDEVLSLANMFVKSLKSVEK
ncbi:hypothetical protein J4526_04135 [Desulfurococcaceae archaeon MEX13E-LK6-19]|nr:hypothetical protein J4526_04135 [Desulfurococcaceae archaeon MEX13E-LK6-19]